MSLIRTGQFDKIAGENKQSAVRTVAIWKGAHEQSGVGIYNLVARPINKKSSQADWIYIFISSFGLITNFLSCVLLLNSR